MATEDLPYFTWPYAIDLAIAYKAPATIIAGNEEGPDKVIIACRVIRRVVV